MQTEVSAIFEEYEKAKKHKESLGEKGLYEQSKINARFYSGDQWYGVSGGNDRPLVRHNIIKRIGDFKMTRTAADMPGITFVAESAENPEDGSFKDAVKSGKLSLEGEVSDSELIAVCKALDEHYRACSLRVDLDMLSARVLRDAYITGTGVLYSYFDSEAQTGLTVDGDKVKGDVACEVLNIADVYFGAAGEPDIQSQPFIILAAMQDKEALLAAADRFGTAGAVKNLQPDDDGRVLVLTKLFKVYSGDGTSVHCIKVTEDGYLRKEYDTKLHLYPISVFRFGESDGSAYGESEITYLIPNQIAINRMITAGVWSNISTGMPIMVVNGDTVSGEISNDPGQIIKIYGSNEDVSGAIKYITPPDSSSAIVSAVNDLIENTLTQSGANPAILGDESAQNASALSKLQTAALMPLNVLKWRFKDFINQNARIWADFWLNLYGNRKIKIEDESGTWYFPFNAARYKGKNIGTAIDTSKVETFTGEQKLAALGTLYDKGIITAAQYLSRLPEGLIPERGKLISDIKETKDEDN